MKLTKRLLLAVIMLVITVLIPFILPQNHLLFGKMLQPMHTPVLLSAYIAGAPLAAVIGAVAPVIRHIWVGMPTWEIAVPMCFELATYGLVTGIVYKISSHRGRSIVKSLLAGMIAGRIVWGVVNVVMNQYTFAMVMSEGFGNAFPGIVLQLFLVPLVIYGLKKIHKIK
ncbi:MAG: ECF transporter S component [Oscillospiraceae bacterium]|nr:ECF transporter S component [Oscillospiraceae bacterium]